MDPVIDRVLGDPSRYPPAFTSWLTRLVTSKNGFDVADSLSIRGKTVSHTNPVDGQPLLFNGTSKQWEPTTLTAAMVQNAADKSAAADQLFTGNVGAKALGINATPGGAGTLTLSGRIFSGAAGTGGIWVDGSSQFVGSNDATHMGFYLNSAWRLLVDTSGNLTVTGKVKEAARSVTTAVPGTFTPDVSLGLAQIVQVTSGGAGTLTIAAPLNPPASGQACLLVIGISNAGGGTITISWNAAYNAGNTLALPTSMATGKYTAVTFLWDGGGWHIVSIG